MPDQCDNCKFYRQRNVGSATVFECRVSDPQAFGTTGVWPRIIATDWCGKWMAIGAAAGREYQAESVAVGQGGAQGGRV